MLSDSKVIYHTGGTNSSHHQIVSKIMYSLSRYIYVQFISRSCKILKLCASLQVAKAPVLLSLLEKKVILCSRFPDEEYIDFWISVSHLCVEWQQKPQEKAAFHSCLQWKKLLCRPFEASNLSQGKPNWTVKQRDSNKRLFWCEDKTESF